MQAPPPPEEKGPSRKEVFESQEYHKRFDNPFDPAVAYWVGVLMSDGCVSDTDIGRSKKVTLTRCDEDKEHLHQFLRFVGVERALVPCDHLDPAGNRQLGYNTTVSSDPICDALISYGVIPRKTLRDVRNTIRASDLFVINSNFWRGMVDSNGSVYDYRYEVRLSIGILILKQYEEYLRYIGIGGSLQYFKNQNDVDIGVVTSDASKVLAKALYKDAPFRDRLERKYQASVHYWT